MPAEKRLGCCRNVLVLGSRTTSSSKKCFGAEEVFLHMMTKQNQESCKVPQSKSLNQKDKRTLYGGADSKTHRKISKSPRELMPHSSSQSDDPEKEDENDMHREPSIALHGMSISGWGRAQPRTTRQTLDPW